MRERTDIVGLTLAELALALLFCLLATLAPSFVKAQKAALAQGEQAKEKEVLEKRVGDLERENAVQRSRLQIASRQLRSVAAPSCFELGKANDWLFDTTVRGRDAYQVNQQTLTLDAVLNAYSSDLGFATENGCKQRIRTYYGIGVPGIDYDYALRRIEEHFYTKKMGPER